MKKVISISIILLLALPAYFRLFRPGYFSMHDDLQVMRVYEMEQCMNDGQIPCRWSPDMVFGYGQAMFNYYSAAPYYLSVFIRVITPLSILGTVKLLFLIALIGSAVGMYLLARELWGDMGAIASALAYIYAPYHAVDIYVRGALSEAFALMILPYLWLYLMKAVIERKFKWMILSSFWLFALLTTHNISTMIMAPFTVLWVLWWVVVEKKYRAIWDMGLIGLLGLGLAGFFIIPAMLELKLTSSELFTNDYFAYHIHFVSLKQLFLSRIWGYGPSAFSDNDDLSFQIGIVHWMGVIVTMAIVTFWVWRKRFKIDKNALLIGLLSAFFVASAFMTHQRSYIIWQKIPTLSYVQFPWRFLGLSIFFASLVLGAKFKYLKYFKVFALPVAIFLLILLNYKYFSAEHYFYNETDKTKLSGELFQVQQKAAPLDYLPNTVNEVPTEMSSGPQIIQGKGVVSNYSYQTNRFFFDVDLYSESVVEIPVIYFPEWVVIDGDSEIDYKLDENKGIFVIELLQGKHMISGRFVNTTIRDWANAISAGTLIIVLMGWVVYINKGRLLWYKNE